MLKLIITIITISTITMVKMAHYKNIGLSVLESKNIVRQIINIRIRSTYYVFCRRDKNWTHPELLTFCGIIFEGGSQD